ncbi:MAG: PAS domain S-box protein [Phycisphaerae bacterium]
MPDRSEAALSHELFLLMLNLSQLHDIRQIRRTFVEAINAHDLGIEMRFVEEHVDRPDQPSLMVSTRNWAFGTIEIDGDWDGLGEAVRSLLRNAAKMLALIMDNRRQDHLLSQTVADQSSQLVTSEQRLHLAMEATQDALWDWDLVTGEAYMSDRYYRMLGYEPGEFPATVEEFARRVHPADLKGLQKQTTAMQEGRRKVFSCEFRVRAKDGHWHWVMGRGRVLDTDPQGRAQRIVGTTSDIHARKLAQHSLAENQRRLETLLGNLPGMAYRCRMDRNWTMEFVSQGARKLTGYSPEDLLDNRSTPYADLIHPDDRDRVWKRTLRATSRNRPFLLEYRITDAEGREKWVWERGCAVYTDEGQIEALEGFVEDITDRHEALEAVRENEQRFRSLVEGAPDAIFVQVEGEFAYVNAAAVRLFGAEKPENLLGAPILERIDPGYRQTVSERIRLLHEQKQEGEPLAGVALGPDGTQVPVEISAVPVVYDGQPGTIVFARDISRRKELESQLTQAQKMEAIGRLAGGIAHDFNNMLQTILGYSELLLAEVDQEGELREDLSEIREAALRSSRLTRQLLAFARKQTIAPRVLDVNETVAGLLKMLQRLIGEDIDLVWHPGANVWPVRVDPAQLDQVLANLVVNARDAIRSVGTIRIHSGRTELDRHSVEEYPGLQPGQYVTLSVSDTGTGMDEHILSQIFEPFFTTKSPEQGTGLGLATVYGIVKQNDGYITVDSTPGEGTTFCVLLPRARQEAPAEEPAGDSRSYRGQGETILLVEDDRAILTLGERILRRLGYHVLAAEGSRKALELVEAHEAEIDLLMTDVIMPDMSGRELCERLRRMRPRLRCLYMSGYTSDVIATRGVLEEGVRFLQKPFGPSEVAETVRKALDSRPEEASARRDGE